MKKSLLLGIVGLAAAAVTTYGQGSVIVLDNYNSNGGSGGGPLVTYGVNVPLNGVSGALGAFGTGLQGGWTAGLYWVLGTPVISDPAGNGLPNGALTLAAGTGSSAGFDTAATGFFPGCFLSPTAFQVAASGASPIVTVELVAWDTADGSYASALYRGHTAPFTIQSNLAIAPSHPLIGDAMVAAGITGLSVTQVPEPTTLALAGLAGLGLLLFRRKQA